MFDDLVGVLLRHIDDSDAPNIVRSKIGHSRKPAGQVTGNIGKRKSTPLLSIKMDPRLPDRPYIACRGRRNRVQIAMKRKGPDVGRLHHLKNRRSRRFANLRLQPLRQGTRRCNCDDE